MNRRRKIRDARIGRMVPLSLLFHVSAFVMIYGAARFTVPLRPASQTYYVELANLPVASPRSGNQLAEKARSVSSPRSNRHEVRLPSVPRVKSVSLRMAQTEVPKPVEQKKEAHPISRPSVTGKKTQKQEPQEQKPVDNAGAEQELAQKLAALEENVDSRHEMEAIDRLSKKASAGRTGIPNGKGTQAGSDYAGYIQSRLRDAFSETISYRSRNPEEAVLLRINGYGRVIGWSMVESTRDKLFEVAVARAIEIAGEKLPPPPEGKMFKHGYVFRPEGVGKK